MPSYPYARSARVFEAAMSRNSHSRKLRLASIMEVVSPYSSNWYPAGILMAEGNRFGAGGLGRTPDDGMNGQDMNE